MFGCVIIWMDVVKISKVRVKAELKSSSDFKKYEGSAIKKDNEIVYIDDEVKTRVSIGDEVVIERIGDYYLKLRFKCGEKLDGEYDVKYGSFMMETHTHELEILDNLLKIKYDLYINEHLIDTFSYILEYSIDS